MPPKKIKLPTVKLDKASLRLRKKAYDEGLISKTKPESSSAALPIPKELIKYNDKNIMNKNVSRGNKRYLFLFPGNFELRQPPKVKRQKKLVKNEPIKAEVQTINEQMKTEPMKAEVQTGNEQIKNEFANTTQMKKEVSSTEEKDLVDKQSNDGIVKTEHKDLSTPVKLKRRKSGKIRRQLGTLSDLNTNKPKLYIEFPQGRIKMCGTILYPKNKYIAVKYQKTQMQNSGKCTPLTSRGSFDNMVVFPEYYWIGTKEDNPEEKPLPFPEEIKKKPDDFQLLDAPIKPNILPNRQSSRSSRKKQKVKTKEFDSSSDSSDDNNDYTKLKEKTVQRSRRASRKRISYADIDDEGFDNAVFDDDDIPTKKKDDDADSYLDYLNGDNKPDDNFYDSTVDSTFG